MDIETFRALPTFEVARLIREAGPKVCVFPINGTRRWYLLEHATDGREVPDAAQLGAANFGAAYLDAIGQRHVALYRMLFDHGLDTVLSPVFGPDLLERGDDYAEMALAGLARLAQHPDFTDFYQAYRVRVRFYGDYAKHLDGTRFAYLTRLFDKATAQTEAHDRFRLFFGVFAHDATETIAALTVRYYTEYGAIPDKRALLALYYGEYVPPVDLFIGFDRFCAFDMPLVATGDEDLYFTVSPSLYLTEAQLRDILYDHLYLRHKDMADYTGVDSADWSAMRAFYHANIGRTLGVGARQPRGDFWYPTPQVRLVNGFAHPDE